MAAWSWMMARPPSGAHANRSRRKWSSSVVFPAPGPPVMTMNLFCGWMDIRNPPENDDGHASRQARGGKGLDHALRSGGESAGGSLLRNGENALHGRPGISR